MFARFMQHPAKFLGSAFLVSLSFALTLLAVLDLPKAQANSPTTSSHASHPLSVMSAAQPSHLNPFAPTDSADVSIVDFSFNPAVITVTAGTVVTWTNIGSFTHTTTSDAGSSDPWSSGNLAPGGVFTRTFNIPGTYGYHCAIHLSMQGTVVVLAPPQAPVAIDVVGPNIGAAESALTFAAAVSPLTTTQPITYLWEATGQLPVTHTDKGLSDTLVYTWTAAQIGSQLITVTAINTVGSISTTQPVIITPPAAAGVTDAAIVDFAFQPQAITITVGSSVRWINAGQHLHTTTSDVNDPAGWDSGNLNPGDVFTKTFTLPGVYAYHCTIHPGMTGTVTVLTQVYLPLVLR